jgi:tRNA(Arg) A34 adenosine deaminase TadA
VTGPVLPALWQLPFELAWEALRAGSRPIGAVLLDGAGRPVATGRNRSQESTAPPRQLADTAIAHADEAPKENTSPPHRPVEKISP